MIDAPLRAWPRHYATICREFGFSQEDDAANAAWLAERLEPRAARIHAAWETLAHRLAGTTVLVLGAGDNAPRTLAQSDPDLPLLAADGATTAAREVGRIPLLIVTDLDGRVEDEVEAARQGSLVAIHAHGDNLPALQTWLPRFPPESVLGTCQSPPVPPLRNEGGFTDGDRACHLAAALGAARLRLLGFDFSGRPGRYTGSFDPRTKPAKLGWAKRLLVELQGAGVRIEGL